MGCVWEIRKCRTYEKRLESTGKYESTCPEVLTKNELDFASLRNPYAYWNRPLA